MSLPVLQVGAPGAPEILVILFTFVVPLAISFLIYRDAKGRNSRHALAWAVGAFFGSLVVWVLYYVVRDEVGSGRRA